MESNNGRKAGFGLFEGTRARRSQSLVEFALTLPVLLTILAGMVEVGNVLAIYNRVQSSAREGARMGAMGGNNSEVWQVVNQSATSSLVVADDRMTVWIIRPTLDINPSTSPTTGVWSWENAGPAPAGTPWGKATTGPGELPVIECVYPDTCTDTSSFALTAPGVLQAMKAANTSAGVDGSRYVIVIVDYETDLLLNLPWFTREQGRFPMWAYASMREEVNQQSVAQKTSGCAATPIVLNRALITSETEGTLIPADFDITNPARQGIRMNDEGAGRKDGWDITTWDYWNTNENAPHRANQGAPACQGSILYDGALRYPPNTKDPLCGYTNPEDDPGDKALNIGDLVASIDATSVSGGVSSVLRNNSQGGGHIPLKRQLIILIYDYRTEADVLGANPVNVSANGSPPFWGYYIARFARVQIIDERTGANGWIALRFIHWEDTCGQ